MIKSVNKSSFSFWRRNCWLIGLWETSVMLTMALLLQYSWTFLHPSHLYSESGDLWLSHYTCSRLRRCTCCDEKCWSLSTPRNLTWIFPSWANALFKCMSSIIIFLIVTEPSRSLGKWFIKTKRGQSFPLLLLIRGKRLPWKLEALLEKANSINLRTIFVCDESLGNLTGCCQICEQNLWLAVPRSSSEPFTTFVRRVQTRSCQFLWSHLHHWPGRKDRLL